jgi:hypothetical protein
MKDKQGRKKSFRTSTAKVEKFSLPEKCNLKGFFSEKKCGNREIQIPGNERSLRRLLQVTLG